MNFMGRSRTYVPSAGVSPPDAVQGAAQYLRRHYPNVFPCSILITEYGGENKRTPQTWGDQHGLPEGGKGHYYVENVGVITNSALLELARKHEWKADHASTISAIAPLRAGRGFG